MPLKIWCANMRLWTPCLQSWFFSMKSKLVQPGASPDYLTFLISEQFCEYKNQNHSLKHGELDVTWFDFSRCFACNSLSMWYPQSSQTSRMTGIVPDLAQIFYHTLLPLLFDVWYILWESAASTVSWSSFCQGPQTSHIPTARICLAVFNISFPPENYDAGVRIRILRSEGFLRVRGKNVPTLNKQI